MGLLAEAASWQRLHEPVLLRIQMALLGSNL